MQFDKVVQTKNKTPWVNRCQYIILHHTGGGTYEWNINTLSVGKVSCHYVVWPYGKIAKIWNDKDILWHAGDSTRWNLKGMNNYSIGIEIVNKEKTFTDEQRRSVKELVSYLMQQYTIPSKNILRHKDIAPWRKVDVYDEFWNNQYKTFDEYQRSFEYMTAEEKENISNALHHNSRMRSFTSDKELKDLLNKTNTKIREIYKWNYSV